MGNIYIKYNNNNNNNNYYYYYYYNDDDEQVFLRGSQLLYTKLNTAKFIHEGWNDTT